MKTECTNKRNGNKRRRGHELEDGMEEQKIEGGQGEFIKIREGKRTAT
jgi:hypothetical protein